MTRLMYMFLILPLICVVVMAQQANPAYNFASVIEKGAIIEGHLFGPDTAIEGIALSGTGEVAFVANVRSEGFTGVFTLTRLVAAQRETIEGKTLTLINEASLAISDTNQVAFEAAYSDPSGGGVGIFLEKRFITAVKSQGAANDFVLTADGRIMPRVGIAITPAVIVATPSVVTPVPVSTQSAQPLPSGVTAKPDCGKVLGGIINGSWNPFHVNCGDLGKPPAKSPIPPPPPPVTPRPALPAPLQTAPSLRNCSAPAFPFPQEWAAGDDATDAITTHIVETLAKPYTSRFFGIIKTPLRTTHFSAECKAVLIVIGDPITKGHVEVYAPAGLLTRQNPDGTFTFNGVSEPFMSPAITRKETGVKANTKHQIAIPVHGKGWDTVLLGSPADAF